MKGITKRGGGGVIPLVVKVQIPFISSIPFRARPLADLARSHRLPARISRARVSCLLAHLPSITHATFYAKSAPSLS